MSRALAAAGLLLILGGCSMTRKVISTDAAPQAIGPYSQGIDSGSLIFVSGQIPLDPGTGQLNTGSISEQTERVLKNIEGVLKAAGLGMNNVVRTTVYLVDLGDFTAMNEVYARFFPKDHPARSTVQVAALPKGARIEIDAIAAR